MAILAQYLSEKEADTLLVVLSASGISYWTEVRESGITVFLKDQDLATAQMLIEKYFDENPPIEYPPFFRGKTIMLSRSAVWVCCILVTMHMAIVLFGDQKQIFQLYGASASKILGGDLYRSVTALMLHSGALHLVANLMGLAIFGTALGKVAGWGIGWSLIVLAGVLGNLLNAWFYRTGHLSVGSSTALFGAIGLVAVTHVIWKLRKGDSFTRAWLPLGGGLALLGILGASQEVDLMAHFFGFFSGAVLSLFYFIPILTRISQGRYAQIRCGVVLAVFIVVAWLTPFL